MAEFLNSEEEQKRWEEARRYAEERQAQIDEERTNGKAKRQKQGEADHACPAEDDGRGEKRVIFRHGHDE